MEYITRRPEDLGVALAEFRTIRGVSQAELADRLGVQRTYLSKLESGSPTAALERLVAAFSELGLELVVRDRR